MTFQQVLTDVNAIFNEVLDDEAVKIAATSTATDVPGWDSLAHIQLVVAIEKNFQIRFTAGEIRGFKNVGDMCQSIVSKVAKP